MGREFSLGISLHFSFPSRGKSNSLSSWQWRSMLRHPYHFSIHHTGFLCPSRTRHHCLEHCCFCSSFVVTVEVSPRPYHHSLSKDIGTRLSAGFPSHITVCFMVENFGGGYGGDWCCPPPSSLFCSLKWKIWIVVLSRHLGKCKNSLSGHSVSPNTFPASNYSKFRDFLSLFSKALFQSSP